MMMMMIIIIIVIVIIIIIIIIIIRAHVEYDSKSDTCNNRGNWNHFKIIHKTPEQHIGKARNQGTTENRHVGHCTHTS